MPSQLKCAYCAVHNAKLRSPTSKEPGGQSRGTPGWSEACTHKMFRRFGIVCLTCFCIQLILSTPAVDDDKEPELFLSPTYCIGNTCEVWISPSSTSSWFHFLLPTASSLHSLASWTREQVDKVIPRFVCSALKGRCAAVEPNPKVKATKNLGSKTACLQTNISNF